MSRDKYTKKRNTLKKRATLDDVKMRNRYIKALTNCGRKDFAAAAVGLTACAVYNYSLKNPAFAERIDRAIDRHKYKLVESLWKDGVEGREEAVYFMGDVVGTKKKYNYKAAEVLLKAADQQYQNKTAVSHEHSGHVSHTHVPLALRNLSLDQKRQIRDMLTATSTVEDTPVLEASKPDVPNYILDRPVNNKLYLSPSEVVLTDEDMTRLGYEKDS